MFQTKVKVIKNIEVGPKYYKIVLFSSQIARLSQPGQFIEIKVSDNFEPLLRRPFSIHRIIGPNIEIIYEIIGKGTELLSQRKPGEYLDVIGPLGKGFNSQTPNTKHQTPILVAGGMGVAPLVFLAERLAKPKPLVLMGAKTREKILCEKEFRELGCELKIATDDGSRGFRGHVSDLLRNLLSTIDYRPSTIYACGPRPMLKEINRISEEYKVFTQISLEEHMACGIGACLGCVVKTKEGLQRVCKEGPVFYSQDIIWQ